jgi:hypothetical protein
MRVTGDGFDTVPTSGPETLLVAATGLLMYATLLYAAWLTARAALSGGLLPRFEMAR